MSDTLMGHNEAEARLRALIHQTNSGKIEYPSATNNRGQGGREMGREHHAKGDMVGNSHQGENKYKRGGRSRSCHANGDMVNSAMPSQGGSHQPSRFSASEDMPSQGGHHMNPQSGFMKKPRNHYQNHAHGDEVMAENQKHRRGGKARREREHHAFGDAIGNGMYGNNMPGNGMMRSPVRNNVRFNPNNGYNNQGGMNDGLEHHSFGSFIKGVGRGIKRGANQVGHALTPVVNKVGNGVRSGLNEAGHGIMQGLHQGADAAGQYAQGVGKQFGNAASEAGRSFAGNLTKGMNSMNGAEGAEGAGALMEAAPLMALRRGGRAHTRRPKMHHDEY